MHWIRNVIMKSRQKEGRLFRATACFIVIFFVSACSVPKHMRVRSGIDPRHQDDDVRFRTTYFFRVYDLCADKTGNVEPVIDSLYRFRMTGKANALFSKVHFESGTLKKWEIEPFGSNVVFDKKLGRFRFVSRQKMEAQAELEAMYSEIQRRLKLFEKIKQMVPDAAQSDLNRAVKESVNKLIGDLALPKDTESSKKDEAQSIQAVFNKCIENQVPNNVELQLNAETFRKCFQENTNGAPPAPGVAADCILEQVQKNDKLQLDVDKITGCIEPEITGNLKKLWSGSNGPPDHLSETDDHTKDSCQKIMRGFQIYGPEGVRTFEQDDRLVMAMSSSAKPLIGALKELAGRVLNEQSTEAETLLPLVQERLLIIQAERELDQVEQAPPERSEEIVTTILRDFENNHKE